MAKKVFDKRGKRMMRISPGELDALRGENQLILGDTLEEIANELGIVTELTPKNSNPKKGQIWKFKNNGRHFLSGNFIEWKKGFEVEVIKVDGDEVTFYGVASNINSIPKMVLALPVFLKIMTKSVLGDYDKD